MLTIREEQFQAFAQAIFESWMVEHLEKFFHEETADLGAEEIRSRIRAAVKRAHGHGFVRDPQVSRYVDLTFIFGPAFDQDPGLPWAAEILGDQRVTDPAMRMDLLYGAAQDHVERAERMDSSREVSQ